MSNEISIDDQILTHYRIDREKLLESNKFKEADEVTQISWAKGLKLSYQLGFRK